LLAGGVIGPPIFMLAFWIEGLARPGYDAWRHPVSSLAIGDAGWIQDLSFIVAGLSILALAIGLAIARSGSKVMLAAAICLAGAAIGLAGAGVFRTDAVFGYPPDAPLALEQFTDRGRLHDAFSRWVFRGIPLASFLCAFEFGRHGQRRWALYSAASGLGMIVLVILAGLGFTRALDLASVAGLLQRSSIVIGFVWMTLLAVRMLRRSSKPASAEPAS
jgi:hypothetical protein